MEEKEKKKDNFVKKLMLLPTVLQITLVVVILVLVFCLGTVTNSRFLTNTKSTKFGLEDVGELVTQTCYVTVVEDSKTNREFFNLFDIPFTESRQIFSYDVEVDASLNFKEILYDVDDNNEKIKVTLPHAKIYKATLNLFSFKVYLDSGNLFSRISLDKQNEALKSIEEQAVVDAKANGIIEAADNNAKTLIEGFIKGKDKYKDYEIIYEFVEGDTHD